MKNKSVLFLIALAVFAGVHQLTAQGTAFTYQGRLNDGSNPANGRYDLKFSLFDAVSAGNQAGNSLTNTPVTVSNGLFTVLLDFGANFPGAARWLDIGVRSNGTVVAYSTLSPRQPLTPSPYAITAGNVNGLTVQLNTNGSPSVVGGSGLNYVTPGTLGAFIGGGGAANYGGTAHSNSVGAAFGAIGGGYDNAIQSAVNGVIAGGHANSILGNASGGVVGGGDFNQVGSGAFNATIAGGYNNSVAPSAYYSTIAGGLVNYASAPYATVVGGDHNAALGSHAFVGGGSNNIAKGFDVVGGGMNNLVGADFSGIFCGYGNYIDETPGIGLWSFIGGGEANSIFAGSEHAVVGGGFLNQIQNNSRFSTICGGLSNLVATTTICSTIGGGNNNTIQLQATGASIGGGGHNMTFSNYSTISGGLNNLVSQAFGTVPGGDQNVAGLNGFAAGHRAKAFYQGDFVWADSQDTDFAATTSDQFLIRAANGVGIGTTSPGATLSLFNSSSDAIFKLEDRRADASSSFLSKQSFYDYYSEAAYVGLRHNGGMGPPVRALVFGMSADNSGPASEVMRIADNGKIGIHTTNPTHSLDVIGDISSSSTVYANGVALTSDRNAKENFTSVNALAVLAKVAALPMTQWNYKTDSKDVQHLGPMAQDFQSAFGLDGADDKRISVIDEGGVALAAIQGLNQKLEEQAKERDVEIQDLKQSVADLKKLMQSLTEKK